MLFAITGSGRSVYAAYAVAVAMLGFWFYNFIEPPRRERKAADFVQRSRAIVDFSHFGGSLGVEDRLALRSNDNKRLVRAFGIHNSLTTYDPHHHRRFVSNTRHLTSKKDGWLMLYSSCATNIRDIVAQHGRPRRGSVEDDDSQFPILLAPLVQHVCFRGALDALFGSGATSNLSDEDVEVVTEDINQLWVESKHPEAEPDSTRLRELLERAELPTTPHVLEARPATAEEALGVILPAYETLWRVVLLTYVHAYHRSPDYENITQTTATIPDCLGAGTAEEKSALKVAKEGLRLYPSTKRIYRATAVPGDDPTGDAGRVSADVERCHRHPDIWGADALRFRPERFDNLTPMQKSAYFPFGLSKHQCPAYSGFGERLVTLLVVALARALPPPDKSRLLFRGDGVLDANKTAPLPTGRADMDDWVVLV
ncbi:hypothetical protein RB595_000335 [Gaeumannomyces hyphopodioides]